MLAYACKINILYLMNILFFHLYTLLAYIRAVDYVNLNLADLFRIF